MKIALINGSPKESGSLSGQILQDLRERLLAHSRQTDGSACDTDISIYQCNKPQINQQDLWQIATCDALVFAFPLYVDSIPSHLLRCLSQMEEYLRPLSTGKEMRVYALANCGFYEGVQNKLALNMMQNWCARTGLIWGHGLGIGGGGMQASILGIPDNHPMKRGLAGALNNMTRHILSGSSADHAFIDPAIPRFAYQIGGAVGWRQQIKANGLKVKDLALRR